MSRSSLLLLSWALALLPHVALAQAGAPMPLVHLLPTADAASLTWEEQLFPADATIDEVRQAAGLWQARDVLPRPIRLPHGQALWARFQIAPYGALTPPLWVLEFPRPTLDRVEVYRFVDGDLALQDVAGDSIPVGVWPLSARYPMFEVTAAHWSPVVYFVRLVHRGPTTLQAELWLGDESQRRQWAAHLAFGAMFGALGLMVALSAVALARSRRLAFGTLALYGLALGAALLAATGLHGEMLPALPAGLLDRAPSMLILAAAAMGLLHLATAVSLWQLSHRFFTVVATLAGAGLLLAAGLGLLPWPHADVSMAYLGVAAICALMMLEYGRRQGDRWSPVQIASLLPLLLALAVPLAEALGLAPVTAEVLEAICLLAPLHLFVQYFSADAKAAVLTKASARLQASSTVDPLTGLANYRALLELLPAVVQRAGLRRSQGVLLLVELVNEGLLPKAGPMRRREHVVVRAAQLIRSCARDNHLVARIDDTHFAIAMEAPVSLREATDVASHLVAKGLRVRDQPPQYAPLVFRIVISVLPLGIDDVEVVLAAAVRRLRSVPLDNPRRIFLEVPFQGR